MGADLEWQSLNRIFDLFAVLHVKFAALFIVGAPSPLAIPWATKGTSALL